MSRVHAEQLCVADLSRLSHKDSSKSANGFEDDP